jgi:hypothetical protein
MSKFLIILSKFLVILCACLCLPSRVLGWGAEGHMVVAQIAYNHLDSEVKAKCDALIAVTLTYTNAGTSNFVTAAVWADDFKSQLGTGSSHYIDLPFSLDGYPTNGVSWGPPNVVSAINQSIATLQSTNASLTDQATSLRYLLHFVGDIEQPLHCSDAVFTNQPSGDAGGNGFYITGKWNNLHSLWDAGGGYLSDSVPRPLTAAGQTTLSNKAAAIEAAYSYTATIGSIPDPMDWALESFGLAQTVSYVGIASNANPSVAYTNTAQATTVQRMAIGGQRLAKLLSTIFVTNAPTLTSMTLSNGNFNLSWSAVPGRIYRVQWKPQPDDTTWTDLTDITASTNSVFFSDPIGQTQRFYRVIVVN